MRGIFHTQSHPASDSGDKQSLSRGRARHVRHARLPRLALADRNQRFILLLLGEPCCVLHLRNEWSRFCSGFHDVFCRKLFTADLKQATAVIAAQAVGPSWGVAAAGFAAAQAVGPWAALPDVVPFGFGLLG